MKMNMKHVAEHCGVSLKTVSRVINGEPHVSVQTRRRVEEMITALGYRPNHSARSLRSGRTQTIRLMIVRRFERFLTEPFTDELVSGIVDAAALAGYALLIEVVGPKRQGGNTHHSEGRLVDGTILIDGRPESPDLPTDRHDGVPCVVVPTIPTDPSIGWVYADFLGGSERITNQLIKLGHRRIAHLAGRLSLPERDRLRGYRRALTSAGIPVDPELIVAAGHLRHHGYVGMEKLLARLDDFTAVFAVNDSVAAGAMECLQQRGYRIPDSISVVGFDDSYPARYAVPQLSTVELPAYEMGVATTKLLIDAIVGAAPFPSGRIFPVNLVIRASTREPPTQPTKRFHPDSIEECKEVLLQTQDSH